MFVAEIRTPAGAGNGFRIGAYPPLHLLRHDVNLSVSLVRNRMDGSTNNHCSPSRPESPVHLSNKQPHVPSIASGRDSDGSKS
jgi:hypothetical protein